MGRLHQQVQSSSCVAHFWLRQHVFPAPRRPEWPHAAPESSLARELAPGGLGFVERTRRFRCLTRMEVRIGFGGRPGFSRLMDVGFGMFWVAPISLGMLPDVVGDSHDT